MNPNAELLQRLFNGLNQGDHQTMAACYHSTATFQDIAFDLEGRSQIHAMWHMICGGDIRTTFEIVQANDRDGLVKLVDEYTFSETGRRVRNAIESRFRFENGKIVEQRDSCDARLWAEMALGRVLGFLPGRIRLVRRVMAKAKLAKFIRRNPQYRIGISN